eukprot:TRINITY_DN18411_c0_g1_i1.p4 TRINITY_DN18411_c0_g1~~TRINITY_DN18411_c0_g1_i1.p4  ORF type:complete len:108 (-),score=36.43 TRINITY_DN18411_c0_g1_i1:230-553(-)
MLHALIAALPSFPAPVYDVAWHPTQHLIAVACYGPGQQVYVFSEEFDGDAVRPALAASVINHRAGHKRQQQVQQLESAALQREATKKQYFEEYMAEIYKSSAGSTPF